MTIYALVSENSPVRLWGLNSGQRLQRQLRAIGKDKPELFGDIRWLRNAGDAPASARVLLLNGSFLFENRTLNGVLESDNSILLHNDGSAAAAFVDASRVRETLEYMQTSDRVFPQGLQTVHTSDM